MKKKFCKLLALCLSLLCFVASLVGCGKSEPDIVTDDTDYTQETPAADPAPKEIGPLKIREFNIKDEEGESRTFDKKIVDYRMTDSGEWCLTEDGALYKEDGAPFTLELRCLSTGLSDLNYLCEKDSKYLFASDSNGNFITATADEDSSIYSIKITGHLKDGQQVTEATPNKDDGENNTYIELFDQTSGDEYSYLSTAPQASLQATNDFNSDGKWYYCPSDITNVSCDGQIIVPIQTIAKGWYLSKDGNMYLRHSDSSQMDTDIPSCLQGVKFTKLTGTNDSRHNSDMLVYWSTYAYAVADNNDLYVLGPVGDGASVRAIIHGLSGDLINATYNKNSGDFIILTSEGYYTCEWDYDWQYGEVVDLPAQANEKLNSVADQIAKMEQCGASVYFVTNDGYTYRYQPN